MIWKPPQTRFHYNTPAIRGLVIGAFLLTVIMAHWGTPTQPHYWHAIHLVLRKLFFVPVVLAAIWFNLRGAFIVASAATILYVPHVFLQWPDQYGENINQVGELVTVWVTAILAGVLVGIEKRALLRLAATHEGALFALVSALDVREHDTQLHSLRVRAYAIRLGTQMGMAEHDLTILGEAALLHDVGKIGIPDKILLKPGSLTDEEWRLMREHADIGKGILESVDFLNNAAEIVYCHHEKFDGSGYPRGLSGEEIPAGARVFALADAYDALVSERPYKAKMSYEDAKDKIEAESDAHFDPAVLDAFRAIPKAEWEHVGEHVEFKKSWTRDRN